MMKVKDWWNKPWTNGTYIKLTGICWALSLVAGLGTYVFIKHKYNDNSETTED